MPYTPSETEVLVCLGFVSSSHLPRGRRDRLREKGEGREAKGRRVAGREAGVGRHQVYALSTLAVNLALVSPETSSQNTPGRPWLPLLPFSLSLLSSFVFSCHGLSSLL